jgi:cytochrome c peroxidase
MKHIAWIVISSLLVATTTVFADDSDRLIRRANRYFSPLPAAMPGAENDTPERIALGKKLYFEKRLSINDTQSCASCHRLEDGLAGVDNLPVSPGARGEQGTRNSPPDGIECRLAGQPVLGWPRRGPGRAGQGADS